MVHSDQLIAQCITRKNGRNNSSHVSLYANQPAVIVYAHCD